MFKNPFSFKGRIGRTEYILSLLIYFIPAGLLELILVIAQWRVTFLIGLVPLGWFVLAQGAKRCHDFGKSGWYQLIPFYQFWMIGSGSQAVENKFGPAPFLTESIDQHYQSLHKR